MRLLVCWLAFGSVSVALARPAECVQGLRTHFRPFYPEMANACAGGSTSEQAVSCLEALRAKYGATEGAGGAPAIASAFWTLAAACAGGSTAKRAESCLDYLKDRWNQGHPRTRYPKELAYACAGDRPLDEAWSCADGVMARRGFENLHLAACQGGTTHIQAVRCLDGVKNFGYQAPWYAGACAGSNTSDRVRDCVRGLNDQLGAIGFLPLHSWACAGGRTSAEAWACLDSRQGSLHLRAERYYATACAVFPGTGATPHAVTEAQAQ